MASPVQDIESELPRSVANTLVEDGVDKGPRVRAGFVAETAISRHDFGVSWNDTMDRGGIVVGNMVHVSIDAEAVLDA